MKTRHARDVLGIFGTRALWSLMGIVSGVILARWLGPHDRGILALVLLVPNTVVTIVKLGISQASVYSINREGAPAERVASNVVSLGLWSGVLASLVVWALRENLLSTVLRDIPAWALALALVRVPLLLIDNYLFGVLQATGKFTLYNVRLLLSESLRLVLVVLALVVIGWGLRAAVVIYTLVGFWNVVWLLYSTYRQIPFSLRVDWVLMRGQLSFGVKSYVQTVTAHLLLRISVYMVTYFLTPVDTAFYALSLHFTELVLELPQAIGLVLFPRLAALPEKEVHRLTAQTCRRTLALTVPAAAAIALFGPWVIVLWYGEPYAPAGEPLPWAAIGVAMMSIFVILTRDFTSRGFQRVNIIAGLVALVSNVGLNAILIPAYGIVGAAQAAAISYSGACVVLLVFFVLASRMSVFDVLVPKGEDVRYFWAMGLQMLNRARGAAS
jgi:O-antigen/teichoic acid export membrane protein